MGHAILSHACSKSKPCCARSPRHWLLDRAGYTLGRKRFMAQRALLLDTWGQEPMGGLCLARPWLSPLPCTLVCTASGLWFADTDACTTETSEGSRATRGKCYVRKDGHPSQGRPHFQPAEATKEKAGYGRVTSEKPWQEPLEGACGTQVGPEAGWTRAAREPALCSVLPSCYGEIVFPPNSYAGVLDFRTSGCDLIWRKALYRSNQIKMRPLGWALLH